MLKTLAIMTGTTVAVLGLPDCAMAQYPSFGSQNFGVRRSTPTVSPYLNLLRGGGIGSNYYQRVRPEMEFRNANQNLNQSLDSIRQRIQEQERRGEKLQSGLTQTGHAPRFMDLGGYFPGFGRR